MEAVKKAVKLERSIDLANQIIMLNEQNKKILTAIVKEMFIAEKYRKIEKSLNKKSV